MRLPIQILAVVYRMKAKTPEFLLFKRIPEKGGFWLSISGGYEETDTSLVDTCYREMKEEADIQREDIVAASEKLYIFQFTETVKNKEDTNYKTLVTDQLTLTTFIFGFELKNGIEPKLIEEHTEYKWCTLEEAISLLKFEETKDSIKAVYNYIVSEKPL